jgi:hypothetical protein
MDIKVLGPGCPNANRRKRSSRMPLPKAVLKRRWKKSRMSWKLPDTGVFGTPAVVIDGEVKSVGKIPKKE